MRKEFRILAVTLMIGAMSFTLTGCNEQMKRKFGSFDQVEIDLDDRRVPCNQPYPSNYKSHDPCILSE